VAPAKQSHADRRRLRESSPRQSPGLGPFDRSIAETTHRPNRTKTSERHRKRRFRRVPKPREASPPSRRTDGASHTDAAEPPRATRKANEPTRTASSGIDAAARSSNSSETHPRIPPSPGLGRRGCPSRDTSPRRGAAIAEGRTSSRERRFGAVGEGVPPRRDAAGDVVRVKGPETPRSWHRLLMRSTERRSLRTAMAWAVTR